MEIILPKKICIIMYTKGNLATTYSLLMLIHIHNIINKSAKSLLKALSEFNFNKKTTILFAKFLLFAYRLVLALQIWCGVYTSAH